jgi:hypothetical protein
VDGAAACAPALAQPSDTPGRHQTLAYDTLLHRLLPLLLADPMTPKHLILVSDKCSMLSLISTLPNNDPLLYTPAWFGSALNS